MHNLVHVDAIGVGLLLVVTIPARVEQHLVLLVLFRVQHVVAGRKEIEIDVGNPVNGICFSSPEFISHSITFSYHS